MSTFAGSLVPVEAPLVPLVLVPLLPALSLVLLVVLGERLDLRRRGFVASASTGLALLVALINALGLVRLDAARRSMFESVTSLVRIGSLDASLAFVLDPSASVFLLAALGSILFVQARVWRKEPSPSSSFFSASSLLAFASGLVLLAADGVVLLFGFGAAGVATYLLVDRARTSAPSWLVGKRLFLLSLFGDQSLLLALALLFWGLGGSFLDGDYLSDYRPRFVAVHAEGRLPVEPVEADDDDDDEDDERRGERSAAAIAARMGQRGTLTMTSHPGARVVLGVDDEAQLARGAAPFAVTPFVRKEIAAGTHSVVVLPGGGATVTGDGHEIAWIERLVVADGEDVRIVPLGSTITFREVRDQLSFQDDAGARPIRSALLAKRFLGSFALTSWVGILLVLFAAAKSAMAPFFGWVLGAVEERPSAQGTLLSSVVVSLAVYVLVRLEAVLRLSEPASVALLVIGALSLVLALLRALREPRSGQASVALSLSLVGAAFVASGLGSPWAATGLVVANALLALVLGSLSAESLQAFFTRARRFFGLRVVPEEKLDGFAFDGAFVEAMTAVAAGALWLVSAIESLVSMPAAVLDKQSQGEPGPVSEPASAPVSAPASAPASAPVSAPASARANGPRRKKSQRRSK